MRVHLAGRWWDRGVRLWVPVARRWGLRAFLRGLVEWEWGLEGEGCRLGRPGWGLEWERRVPSLRRVRCLRTRWRCSLLPTR